MQFQFRSSRLIALLTGCVLASSVLGVTPARAADKSKNWKYGAVAAGVVGAYLLSKGKVAPAAAAAAGGYYAYKKGGDVSEEQRRDDRFGSRGSNRNREQFDLRNGNRDGRFGNRERYDVPSVDVYGDNGYEANRNAGRGTYAGRDVYPGQEGSFGAYGQTRSNAKVRDRRRERQNPGNYDFSPYLR